MLKLSKLANILIHLKLLTKSIGLLLEKVYFVNRANDTKL